VPPSSPCYCRAKGVTTVDTVVPCARSSMEVLRAGGDDHAVVTHAIPFGECACSLRLRLPHLICCLSGDRPTVSTSGLSTAARRHHSSALGNLNAYRRYLPFV